MLANPVAAPCAGKVARDERQRVLALVEQNGWNATAFQTLERGFSYFFHQEGCVAYVDTGRAWVAAGAPIANEPALARVAQAFLINARKHARRACFFGTEERFVSAGGPRFRSLLLGEQPVWDPRLWPETLRRRGSLREQLRRARAKGVVIRELEPTELGSTETQGTISSLVKRWLETRALAPMQFLLQVAPFEFATLRRCFVAEREGTCVGFAGVVPVPAREGWFLEDLLRDPSAPNGTSELLVDAVMRATAAQGSGWLTLGLSPLSGDVGRVLRAARKTTRFLYDFEGLAAYKAKLDPTFRLPIYLTYPGGQPSTLSLVDALSAFAGGDFLNFGLRCLKRLAPFPGVPSQNTPRTLRAHRVETPVRH